MKYIETFFKFPIRIYEEKDFKEAKLLGKDVAIPYHVGAKLLTYTDITGWQDYKFGEPQEEGAPLFPGTLVEAHGGNREYFCDWPRRRFEAELEKFAEKMEEAAKEEIAKYVEAENAARKEEDLILGPVEKEMD